MVLCYVTLFIYFGLFSELFESSLEKGIFLVILMFTVLVKIIPDCFLFFFVKIIFECLGVY